MIKDHYHNNIQISGLNISIHHSKIKLLKPTMHFVGCICEKRKLTVLCCSGGALASAVAKAPVAIG